MTAVDRALKYGVFAVIATLINLASQELMIRVYSGSYALYVALLVGTMTGLISKYCLDKKFIFAFFTRSQRHNSRFRRLCFDWSTHHRFILGFRAGFRILAWRKVSALFRRSDRTDHRICCKVSTRQPDGFCLHNRQQSSPRPIRLKFG